MANLRLVWVAVPILNTAQQVLLKFSADADAAYGNWPFQVLHSYWFLGAVVAGLVLISIWMTVLSELDVRKTFPLAATTYILILATATFMFGEPVTPLGVAGSAFILTGAWCIATGPMSE